jgi:uridine kinase
MSAETRLCVKSLGFGSYFGAYKPRLIENRKKRRLRWTKEQVNSTLDQWKSVVWSDESQFSVTGEEANLLVLLERKDQPLEFHYSLLMKKLECFVSGMVKRALSQQ